MNVLIISQYFWPENFKINDLAESLVQKGHTVNVLTGIPNYPQGLFYKGYTIFKPHKEVFNGVSITRVPLIPRGKANGLRLALNYLSFVISSCIYILFHRKQYDGVLVFATSPITVAFPAILYRFIHKTKTLLWVMDLWPESVTAAGGVRNKKVLALLTRMVKFIYSHVDKILISSKNFRSSIEDKGVASNKIFYAPNWAEELYEKPTVDKDKYKSILPDGFKVMFTGNIGEAQDCESILAAAMELNRMQSSVRIIMVGDGRKKKWFEDEVQRCNIQNVHFVGSFPASEMPNLICHADAIIVSLRDELIFSLTVPTRIQTALVSSKPIVAMLNGEGADIIREANAGLVCSAGDSSLFATHLNELSMMSKSTLIEMGGSGKRYYSEYFNRNRVIESIELLLES